MPAIYYLVNVKKQQCVIGADGDTTGALYIQDSTSRTNGMWSLTPVYGGSYLLIEQKFGKCLQAAGSSAAPTRQAVTVNTAKQRWKKVVKSVDAFGVETVNLIDEQYNLALYVGDDGSISQADPATVQNTPNAQFTLTPFSDCLVQLRIYSGQYVQLSGDNQTITGAGTSAPGAAELFLLIELGGGRVALQSTKSTNYLSAANGGGAGVIATQNTAIGPWECFQLTDLGGGSIALRANNGQYLSSDVDTGGVALKANRDSRLGLETFTLIKQPSSLICLRSFFGQYVHVDPADNLTLTTKRKAVGGWEPFHMLQLDTNVVALRASNGKYVQAVNGGGDKLLAARMIGIGPWEKFTLTDLGSGGIALQASNGKYVSQAQNGGGVPMMANANTADIWETLGIVRQPTDFAWETISPNLPNVNVESDGGVASFDNQFQRNGMSLAGVLPSLDGSAVTGGAGTFVVDSAGKIFRFQSATGIWEQVQSGPTQIATAKDGETWGINAAGNCFRWNGSGWDAKYGTLAQISVASSALIFGANTNNDVFSYSGGSNWANYPCKMKAVFVAADRTLLGIHPNNGACLWRGGSTWEHLPINMTKMAVASSSLIFGMDASGAYLRGKALPPAPASAINWQTVPVGAKQISAAADGTVYGLDASGNVLRWHGQWLQQPGVLTQISVGSKDNVWGVNAAGNVFRKKSDNSWEQLYGTLKQVAAAADGTVWGVNANNSIFRWNGTTWESVNGILVQIAVGSANLVYGIGNDGAVFKWNGGWDRLPGIMKSLSVAADGTVYGLDNNNAVFLLRGDKVWEDAGKSMKQIACCSRGMLFGIDASDAIFRGLVRTNRIPDPTTRIAVQEERAKSDVNVYQYSTESAADAAAAGFNQVSVAFVAHREPQPGTVPIYQETQVSDPGTHFHFYHRGDAEARSFGWMSTRVAFHAFLYPAPGTVPVYRETVTGRSDYHFSINSAAEAAQKGYTQSDIAFYAYPPHVLATT